MEARGLSKEAPKQPPGRHKPKSRAVGSTYINELANQLPQKKSDFLTCEVDPEAQKNRKTGPSPWPHSEVSACISAAGGARKSRKKPRFQEPT